MSNFLDPFPTDPNRILQELSRRVAALEAQAGQAQGLTVTKASDAFLVPSSGTPATPSDGAYLYVTVGGEMRWRSTMGDRSMIHPQAAAIDNQANMLAGASAPGSYSASYVTDLREDVRATRQYGFDLTTRLRDAGIVDV
ncbi:hypothetical protein [Nonomuraea lactucae]|uniref:hypothetical protein n=1 Tax=Nonomuraea lactucae TaxID=2249762 RepID=UPI000DE24F38|nr:hypothetical protein [Nonomuraea lactucae]